MSNNIEYSMKLISIGTQTGNRFYDKSNRLKAVEKCQIMSKNVEVKDY